MLLEVRARRDVVCAAERAAKRFAEAIRQVHVNIPLKWVLTDKHEHLHRTFEYGAKLPTQRSLEVLRAFNVPGPLGCVARSNRLGLRMCRFHVYLWFQDAKSLPPRQHATIGPSRKNFARTPGWESRRISKVEPSILGSRCRLWNLSWIRPAGPGETPQDQISGASV